MANFWPLMIVSIVLAVHSQIDTTEAAKDIGVCYGMNGDNLPSATDVIALYKKYDIGKMRLYDPNPDALNALKGSQIALTVGLKNEDLPGLAAGQAAVETWFATNIDPYLNDIVFSHITVGNEIIPGELAAYVLPVMQSLQTIIDARGLAGIKVTTSMAFGGVVGPSYPPSNGAFTPEASATMTDILTFLSAHSSPILVNVYPYFAYASDPVSVRLDYALFNVTDGVPVVQDGNLSYFSLYDAMLDAFFWSMEKIGVTNVDVVVSESGWPSAGNGDCTTPQLASTYNTNFISHVLNRVGTPKRPDAYIEGFIFAMFNENLKSAGVEQNWGLFLPSMEPAYPSFPTSL